MRNLNLLFILIAVFIAGCKSSYISIQVLKPAQIMVPADVKTIAFVNRSLPAKKEKLKNIVEGVITGEDPFVDRMASEKCIHGVFDGLSNSPRFRAVLPGNVDLRGTGTREFPEPLDWRIVDDICKQNNADALACLEVFDSDNRIGMSDRKVTRKQNDKEVTSTEYTATLLVNVQSGWRIYYPAKKQILDQNTYNDSRSWSNTSDAGKRAEAGLPGKDRAAADAGYYSGSQYSKRISPLWIWVSRDYYRKGNTDFERARRKAETNDWKGAAELWQKYTNSNDEKIAGYATYNMALACEMEGDLEAAISWVKKSYVDHNNKHARYYLNTLQQRLNDQYRLDEQMKGSE